MSNLVARYAAPPAAPRLALLLRYARLAARWMARRRQRRALAELDAHLLRDVGLTAEQARREAAKWFWMP
jgi:uncharacterized protein YjiS (DUF1127 family)